MWWLNYENSYETSNYTVFLYVEMGQVLISWSSFLYFSLLVMEFTYVFCVSTVPFLFVMNKFEHYYMV